LPVLSPLELPRLNLGYNLPSIGSFVSLWAPLLANWQYSYSLAYTFSGLCVASWILAILEPSELLRLNFATYLTGIFAYLDR
jgi:hypothetical protein